MSVYLWMNQLTGVGQRKGRRASEGGEDGLGRRDLVVWGEDSKIRITSSDQDRGSETALNTKYLY